MRHTSHTPTASLKKRRADKKGQTLTEYALVLAMLCIVLAIAFTQLGGRVVLIFSAIANNIDTAQGTTTH